jgi:hypothetical protein
MPDSQLAKTLASRKKKKECAGASGCFFGTFDEIKN